MADTDAAAPTDAGDTKRNFNYALVRETSISPDTLPDILDTLVTAVEKHPNNYESAAQMVKETLDRKNGATWHCVIGEGFGFEVGAEVGGVAWVFVGAVGILVWKAS
ncbi:hypothetical protein BC832DRAFT_566717 [Gaertneriomyces semiglobifer]|nr:hypothetical protein BC832DRAFT_566717 [Gaertneriomyces semiglobifer]